MTEMWLIHTTLLTTHYFQAKLVCCCENSGAKWDILCLERSICPKTISYFNTIIKITLQACTKYLYAFIWTFSYWQLLAGLDSISSFFLNAGDRDKQDVYKNLKSTHKKPQEHQCSLLKQKTDSS